MDNAKISAAFVAAQKAFGPALKDKTNPAFKSKYADLSACLDAVIDALNEAGIALLQKTHENERGVTVETVFLHSSGEHMSGGLFAVPAAKQDPQGYGSALTYARRYSLMTACGIAPEDDDGNAATNAVRAATPMAAGVLADWIAHIESSANGAEFKARVSDAQAACLEVGDVAALGKVKSAADAFAKSKTKAAA